MNNQLGSVMYERRVYEMAQDVGRMKKGDEDHFDEDGEPSFEDEVPEAEEGVKKAADVRKRKEEDEEEGEGRVIRLRVSAEDELEGAKMNCKARKC